MTWQDKMIEGMKLIQEACNTEEEFAACWECPFRRFCDIIETKCGINPTNSNWVKINE